MTYPKKRRSLRQFHNELFKPDNSNLITPEVEPNGDYLFGTDYFPFGSYVKGNIDKPQQKIVFSLYHNEPLLKDQFVSFVGRSKIWLRKRSYRKTIASHHLI